MADKTLNILVIDDEEMIRKTIADFLEDYGHDVTTASNGAEGIAKFQKGKFDAVLVDLTMPVMNGFEVLEYLKSANPLTPVIVISGTGKIQEVVKAQRMGAWDYIIKPIFDMILLVQVINKTVEKAGLIEQNNKYRQYLEEEVKKRTGELEETNEKLLIEIKKSMESEEEIRNNYYEIKTTLEELEAINEKLLSSRKELESSEKKYRLLAENVSNNIWILDIDTSKLSYISPSIEKISGYSVNEMLGQSLDKIVTPGSYDQIQKILNIQITDDNKNRLINPVTVEVQLNKKNGDSVWVEITASFLRDSGRNITGILGISREITERKLAEEEIRSSLKEKETLLKEIHHRVKNNMQVISSLLNLQSDYIDNPMHRELFIDSQRRVHSMALIHEKLYQSDRLSAINFNEYVNGLSDELLLVYANDSPLINIAVDINDLFLTVDNAIPCALILNELISNSLKYAFPGKKKGIIQISLYRENPFHILKYSDNGIGIPPNVDYRNPGSMGLELIKLLTEQLNGSFELDKTGGTSYTFKFDFENKKSLNGNLALLSGMIPDIHKKILIVEDDMITATLIKRIIESQNFIVMGIADSAESAMAYINTMAPDLILMDIILKGKMDGIDAVKKIQTRYDIPVIYSTANTDPFIKKRAGETNPAGFITKPINKTELISAIKNLLLK